MRRNSHHGQQRVKAACLGSLQDLQLDYLDLYLVMGHKPLSHPSDDVATSCCTHLSVLQQYHLPLTTELLITVTVSPGMSTAAVLVTESAAASPPRALPADPLAGESNARADGTAAAS